MSMSAHHILALLERKHSNDVFVAECNTGSVYGGCRRMDAWAMTRSWSPWTTLGYEIKVSRSDFLGDEKWPTYLPFCHHFSFVCPYKMIEPQELPDHVGLIWTTKKGNRLHTKRKAVRREPDEGAMLKLLTFVLMSRTRITGSQFNSVATGAPNDEYWAKWLENKKSMSVLGRSVSKELRARVDVLDRKTRHAEKLVDLYEDVRARIVELGFRPDQPVASWAVRDAINRMARAIPERELENLHRSAERMVTAIVDFWAKTEGD